MSTNDTNIEKFSGRMDKEDSGCTISINETIQNIRDVGVVGLYSYLLSKPSAWNICVKEIRNHFSLSKDKAYRLMNCLLELRLLKSIPIREKGRFINFRYKLYLRPFPENQEMDASPVNSHSQPFPEKQAPATPEPVNQDAYKTKINTKQRSLENKEIKTLVDEPSTEKKLRDYEKDENFMAFYSIYPRKEKPKDAWKAFKSLKPDQELLQKIIEDVKLRTEKHTQWRNKQYIPLPASYLRADGFMGEILDLDEEKKQKAIASELEAKKRIAEQERIYQLNYEHEQNKHNQYNQDGAAFRAIKNKVAGEEQRKAMELIRKLK